MKCSVIIPIHNGEKVLSQTLEALREQYVLPGWTLQLVAVNDGSTDATASILAAATWPVHWEAPHIITQQRKGPGAARNAGIRAANGDVLLLLGADIILRPGALAAHLRFHEDYPEEARAALGGIIWDPRLMPTPLMEWLMHGGQQNDFDSIIGEIQADLRHFFYASNISLKKSILTDNQFNEHLGFYGWEDLELGRRLWAMGVSLTLLQDALGLHRHYYEAGDIICRQRQVGASARSYQNQHPHEAMWGKRPSRRIKAWIYQYALAFIARPVFAVIASRYAAPRLFLRITAAEFWVGWYG